MVVNICFRSPDFSFILQVHLFKVNGHYVVHYARMNGHYNRAA